MKSACTSTSQKMKLRGGIRSPDLVVDQFGRDIPAAAKSRIDFAPLSVRLKPCPFKTDSNRATTALLHSERGGYRFLVFPGFRDCFWLIDGEQVAVAHHDLSGNHYCFHVAGF